jgi:hypothetical protein
MTNESEAHQEFTHVWRSKKNHSERLGQPCRIVKVVDEAKHTIKVEFRDGMQVQANMGSIRKIPE